MGRVVVFMNITLDGVIQAPGRPDEDRRGGFQHGGWAVPYADPATGKAAGESMATTGGILLGRRTYEDFYSFWPHQRDNPFTEILNNMQKFVASTTLQEPLPWMNSTLLPGNVPDAVAALKSELDEDLVILGSAELVRSLMKENLIDLYMLLIHPLVLGSGRRLFDDGTIAPLTLAGSQMTSTGVLIASYRPAEHTERK